MGNEDLAKYKEVFTNLTERNHYHVGDGFTVVEVVITYDAKSAVAICLNESLALSKEEEDEFIIRSYNLA